MNTQRLGNVCVSFGWRWVQWLRVNSLDIHTRAKTVGRHLNDLGRPAIADRDSGVASGNIPCARTRARSLALHPAPHTSTKYGYSYTIVKAQTTHVGRATTWSWTFSAPRAVTPHARPRHDHDPATCRPLRASPYCAPPDRASLEMCKASCEQTLHASHARCQRQLSSTRRTSPGGASSTWAVSARSRSPLPPTWRSPAACGPGRPSSSQ
jgi:hypothetical protein